MKTIKDLVALAAHGKQFVVTFKAEVEDLEGYPEAGMKARIVSAQDHHDDVVRIMFDFSDFDAHNKTLEKSNYYDKQGKPTLTAREAGFYKPADHLFFLRDDEVTRYFDIANDASTALLAEFSASGTTSSYVGWLEQELAKARAG